jgi:hypothetical protein
VKRPVLAVALLLLAATGARTDTLPNGWQGPYVYRSDDPAPVTVVMAWTRPRASDESVEWGSYADDGSFRQDVAYQEIALPRNLLAMVGDYATNAIPPFFRHEALPDRVYATRFTFFYNHPAGTPVGGSPADLLAMPGDDPVSLGKGIAEVRPDKLIRFRDMGATISLAVPNPLTGEGGTPRARTCQFSNNCPGGSYTRLDDYEGFRQYEEAGTTRRLIGTGPDEMQRITCSGDATGNPLQYCSYEFPINGVLSASLTFLDLRHHGGRAFAQARIRRFKELFCPSLGCDARALAAAGLP